MFASSDRIQSPQKRMPLTSANVLPVVAANRPELTTAVTSREHRPAPTAFGAVEEGEHSRSLLANETRPSYEHCRQHIEDNNPAAY
jgi:hypothetical protein